MMMMSQIIVQKKILSSKKIILNRITRIVVFVTEDGMASIEDFSGGAKNSSTGSVDCFRKHPG